MHEQAEIRTLIFDFDGLLVDSETVFYRCWLEVYQQYRCTLPLEQWIQCIGSSAMVFDAHAYLETLIGQPLARQALDAQHASRQMELMANLGPLLGVEHYLRDASQLGLKTGLASSVDCSIAIQHMWWYFRAVLRFPPILERSPQ